MKQMNTPETKGSNMIKPLLGDLKMSKSIKKTTNVSWEDAEEGNIWVLARLAHFYSFCTSRISRISNMDMMPMQGGPRCSEVPFSA